MDWSLFMEFQFTVIVDLTKLREAAQVCSLHLLLWLFRRRCTLELLNIVIERKMATFKVTYEWWDVTLMTKFCFYFNQENKVIEQRHSYHEISLSYPLQFPLACGPCMCNLSLSSAFNRGLFPFFSSWIQRLYIQHGGKMLWKVLCYRGKAQMHASVSQARAGVDLRENHPCQYALWGL